MDDDEVRRIFLLGAATALGLMLVYAWATYDRPQSAPSRSRRMFDEEDIALAAQAFYDHGYQAGLQALQERR